MRRRGARLATVASASAEPDRGSAITQRQRDAGVSHDEAIYTCECGFVFRALVCTSVDCPHCGCAQAW